MKQVQISADNFNKLKATLTWYDAMPGFLEVGDRFHERMSEEIDKLLPAMEELDSDDYYLSNIDVVDDKLIMVLTSTDDPEEEVKFELIPV